MNKLFKASSASDCILCLATGEIFFGKGVGVCGEISGEVCFNTSITGYQEILTDPSYTGQIINFTMPHIGNVGANIEDNESNNKFAAGLIVREPITNDSNYRSEHSLNNWLIENNLTGISGIDTRAITHLIRKNGHVGSIIKFIKEGESIDLAELSNRAKLVTNLEGKELSKGVSTKEHHIWEKPSISHEFDDKNTQSDMDLNIVVIDFGVKNHILNCLINTGCSVKVVNCDFDAEEIIAMNPDGIFLSNGPGDPDANAEYAIAEIRKLLEKKIPIFGICMGHQLLSLAANLKTFKMHQGHRGVNHPILNLKNKTVEITSQNHGFCVANENLPENVEVTHISLFDGTVEGIKLLDRPAFSVQYHPESSSGPHDSRYLFKDFITMIRQHKAA
jgi:carbamoyl-phosphate synthase small subunit